jgi:hypothetical protein
MSTGPPVYDIGIWLETSEDPAGAADALVQALGEVAPSEARGVRVTDRGVTVEFPDMQARQGQDVPGNLELDQAELHRILPVLQALLSVSAARVRAGIAPSQRIVIDVRPSELHRQEELRHS